MLQLVTFGNPSTKLKIANWTILQTNWAFTTEMDHFVIETDHITQFEASTLPPLEFHIEIM